MLKLPPLEAEVELIPAREEPIRFRRLEQARSLAHSAFTGLPAKAAFLYSKDFRARVAQRIRTARYDLAIVNGLDLVRVLDTLPISMPRILVAHNLEHRLFRTQIENLGGGDRLLGGFLRADCARLEAYEWKGMRESGNVVFLSRDEAACAAGMCPGLRSITVPPVFEGEPAVRKPRQHGPFLELGLVGDFEWWPNRLSLRWFEEEVLPGVKTPVRLNLFGRPGGRRRRGDNRILEHGAAENMRQVWERCDVMLCPARVTAGVSVKLAEALYNGAPVLATTAAARGLGLVRDPAVVLLDEPGEWVEFLNSPAALQLAERQVSEETRSAFTVGARMGGLQQFVMDVLAARQSSL